jgi:hypothetical protein
MENTKTDIIKYKKITKKDLADYVREQKRDYKERFAKAMANNGLVSIIILDRETNKVSAMNQYEFKESAQSYCDAYNKDKNNYAFIVPIEIGNNIYKKLKFRKPSIALRMVLKYGPNHPKTEKYKNARLW